MFSTMILAFDRAINKLFHDIKHHEHKIHISKTKSDKGRKTAKKNRDCYKHIKHEEKLEQQEHHLYKTGNTKMQ